MFVRLQGCDVGCPWCNERQTWPAGGTPMDVSEITKAVSATGCQHIVITGGEPLAQPIAPLVGALLVGGYRVQVESSGTYPLTSAMGAWITVAPKFGMRRPVIVTTGMDEIKVMVGKSADIDAARPMIAANPGTPVFLHPISGSAKATAICVQEAMANNWRVSVQLHEVLGLR